MKTIILLLLCSSFVMAQKYKAVIETFPNSRVELGIAELKFDAKYITVKYPNSRRFQYRIISHEIDYYFISRDSIYKNSDFWIITLPIRKPYIKIVRIWSNQQSGHFGRITYTLIEK